MLVLNPLEGLEPAAPWVAGVLDHLTGTKMHDAYLPVVLFTGVHAARVAVGWAAATSARGPARAAGIPFSQDLFGYLVVAWGGGTLAAMLMGTPPIWLVNPWVWVVYVGGYVALVETRAAYLVAGTRNVVVQLALALVDGMLRGKAVSAMWEVSQSSPATQGSWLAAALLGAVATCGGGWVAQTLGLAGATWRIGTPGVLRGGVLGTLDVWAPMVVSVAYATMARGMALNVDAGRGYVQWRANGKAVEVEHARAIAVILMAALFASRVLCQWASAPSATPGVSAKEKLSSPSAAISEKQGDAKVKHINPGPVKLLDDGAKHTDVPTKKAKSRKHKKNAAK